MMNVSVCEQYNAFSVVVRIFAILHITIQNES